MKDNNDILGLMTGPRDGRAGSEHYIRSKMISLILKYT